MLRFIRDFGIEEVKVKRWFGGSLICIVRVFFKMLKKWIRWVFRIRKDIGKDYDDKIKNFIG